ncbi:hypothetical protein CEXT_586041 [Caerostris extrusa]|uniref:Uncharacterized protein n=1 Tax=Caerostris extrusa TaxID=172846 RepID=A0AAV4QQK6_CAEEX|nr:hypothetical protein CEXT_586041 [Caerostris extrusa]
MNRIGAADKEQTLCCEVEDSSSFVITYILTFFSVPASNLSYVGDFWCCVSVDGQILFKGGVQPCKGKVISEIVYDLRAFLCCIIKRYLCDMEKSISCDIEKSIVDHLEFAQREDKSLSPETYEGREVVSI